MQTLFLFLFIHLITPPPVMQTRTLSGDYVLRGIHDMAAAFRFTPDGRFQFNYIYGVVDRMAEGTYTIAGDTVKLASRKAPGTDFTILKESKQGRQITIQVVDANPHLKSYVVAFYGTPDAFEVARADSDGRIVIPDADPKQVYLRHELYVDIPTLIRDEGNANTYFEVGMNPSLAEVSFKAIDLFITEDGLTCHPNYFMPFERILFEKPD
jgi:hypothetical protein